MSDLSTAASLDGEAAAARAGRPGPGTASRRGPGGPGSAVGLDIGGTKVLAAFLGSDGVARETLRLPTVRGPEGVVSSAARAVREVVRRACGDLADVDGVGVGVPGLVDPADGSVVHAVNLGIEGGRFALAEALSAELGGVPVQVDNDLNVAALGASHLRGAEGEDLAFLALGTGL
ncbi:MAG: ROK family protein, partial [Cellulosimicrobium funkei]